LLRQIAFSSMFLVLLLASVSYRVPVSAASPPQLILDPASIVNEALTAGNNITLTAKVLDVTNLFAYEFKIYYNRTVLNCTKATRPAGHFMEPQLDPGSQFIPKWELKDNFNATHGRLWLSLTLLAPETGRSGSGTLVQITFKILALGNTPITLGETKLVDAEAQSISHQAVSSYFSNLPIPPPPPPANVCVEPQEIVDPALTPSNNFTVEIKIFSATNVHAFEFKLNYTAAVIEALEVTEGAFLKSAGLTSIQKMEINNTLGFVKFGVALASSLAASGNGTLSAVTFHVLQIGATPLTLLDVSLTDPSDQPLNRTVTSGLFSNVVLQGDLNDDGIIDILDVSTAAIAFGATPDNPRWNAKADLNFDGVIDVLDLVMIILNFNGPVVAEFPWFLMLPIFMIATALAVRISKRKR